MTRALFIVALALACASAQAVAFRRSFRRGYPADAATGATTRKMPSTGAKTTGGQKSTQTTTRSKTIRLVRDPGQDFAMKVGRGESVYVELQEPADCRWTAPAATSAFSAIVERGAMAKQRTKNVSGGPGVAVVTVRRLSDGDAELKLVCRKKAAPANAEPERTLLIRLVKP